VIVEFNVTESSTPSKLYDQPYIQSEFQIAHVIVHVFVYCEKSLAIELLSQNDERLSKWYTRFNAELYVLLLIQFIFQSISAIFNSVIANLPVNVFHDVHALSDGVTHVNTIIGAVVSSIIVSVTSLACTFPTLSRNLTYTVLTPSHTVIVCHVLVTHVCRFVLGFAVVQNAICTDHWSVGHVTFNVTDVLFVYVAHVFIDTAHQTGAAESILYIHVAYADEFHAESVLYHTTIQLFVPFVGQYDAFVILVATLHVLAVHHNVWVVQLNIL